MPLSLKISTVIPIVGERRYISVCTGFVLLTLPSLLEGRISETRGVGSMTSGP